MCRTLWEARSISESSAGAGAGAICFHLHRCMLGLRLSTSFELRITTRLIKTLILTKFGFNHRKAFNSKILAAPILQLHVLDVNVSGVSVHYNRISKQNLLRRSCFESEFLQRFTLTDPLRQCRDTHEH